MKGCGGKQFSGSLLEFGSQVMLKGMDKVSGGVMQERWVEGTGWEVALRRSNTWFPGSRTEWLSGLGLCVTFRSRQPWKIWKDSLVTRTPRKVFNDYRRLDVPRPETARTRGASPRYSTRSESSHSSSSVHHQSHAGKAWLF